MMPRPSRILAIADRDLRQELRGRRRILVGVTVLLLGPLALAPSTQQEATETPSIPISGEIPEYLEGLPDVQGLSPGTGPTHLVRETDGTTVVHGQINARLRRHLDGPSPEVRVVHLSDTSTVPGRTLLFALISASVLTGALSESIGGERSRRTLDTLLTASVSRWEIVLGKWAAWSAYGSIAALAASFGAILCGNVSAGWWLIAIPAVPAGMVSLGLFMVRHTTDVIEGSTVSLRGLPVILAVSGALAWWLSQTAPWMGALVPIGGALCAAGDLWAEPVTVLLATTVTLLSSSLWLAVTARALGQPPEPVARYVTRGKEAVRFAATGVLVCWAPALLPLLWEPAGNPAIMLTMEPDTMVYASGVGLITLTIVRLGKPSQAVSARLPGLPDNAAFSFALALGVAFAFTAPMSALLPLGTSPSLIAARLRFAGLLSPAWAGPLALFLMVLGQEAFFRGLLLRRVGVLMGTCVFVLVVSPLDPLRGGFIGASLALLTVGSGGSLFPALLAQATWALCGLWVAPPSPGAAGITALLVLGSIATWAHFRSPVNRRLRNKR